MVIKRAHWPTPARTAGALLSAMSVTKPISDSEIERLDTAQREDRAPESSWPDE